MSRTLLPLLSVAATVLAAAIPLNTVSCSSGSNGASQSSGAPDAGDADGGAADDGDSDGGMGALPFTADSPNVYVAKVKNILVGLPPTDQEIQTVEADPTQLATLVNTWMTSTTACAPSTNPAETCLTLYQTKMQRFFELAFQQTQFASSDLEFQFQSGQLDATEGASGKSLLQSLQESFALTMIQLSASGQPFTQAMTTQSFELTTALKVLYALTDVWGIDDDIQGHHDLFAKANPSLNIYVTGKTAIKLSETLDTTSNNYMHWYVPGMKCATDPVVFPARANELYGVLVGAYDGKTFPNCTFTGPPLLPPASFTDWSMVTIRPPASGEATTLFYDLQDLPTATTLVLNRPYVGFFTTPAFFANWQTNSSNTMRVTMNQTFIVSTGAQVDGTDPTVPASTPGLDSVHAAPGSACYNCHKLLDPSRSIFAKTFSWDYGYDLQNDTTFASQPGLFVFQGVQAPVTSMADLGSTLASHPLVAPGWAQKLCYYVDSEACAPSDVAALAEIFKNSNYSWNQIVKAVVTSPVTTHATATATATTNGEIVGIARRDHLCAAWNARLGFTDYCGLDVNVKTVAPSNALAVVGGLPSDAFARGSLAPVIPNQPTLFFRGGTENVCESIAAILIDNKTPPAGVTTWSSKNPTAAITDFVNLVMGLAPSDPRAAGLAQLLQSHFNAAMAVSGMTATQALQSTFTAACMAPTAVSMGM